MYVNQGMPLLEAVKKTQDRLEGTWGLAILVPPLSLSLSLALCSRHNTDTPG